MKAMYLLATVAVLSVLSSCNSNGGGSDKKDTVVVVEKEHGKGHERHRSFSAASESAGNSNSSAASASPATSTAQPTDAQPTASQPATPQKKGWSAAAKDATIGGAAGAVAGALLDKNSRVVGGVLGGALGAGAGYLIGRSRDRKTGRVVKHQSVEYANSN